MSKVIDLSGYQFGSLTVIERNYTADKKNTHWMCECVCGKVFSVNRTALQGGQKSCGCINGRINVKHGNSSRAGCSREYITWQGMQQRCANLNDKYYGGRGIKVCDRWKIGENGQHGFDCFLADMGVKPKGLEIDRIDNDLGYEPSNCRWVTKSENSSNKRNNIKITIGNERHTLEQWARILNIAPQAVRNFAKNIENNQALILQLLT